MAEKKSTPKSTPTAPPSRTTPTSKPITTPTSTSTKFVGPIPVGSTRTTTGYTFIDPKVQAALDAAKAQSAEAQKKIADAKAKSDAAKKAVEAAKKKAADAAAKKKATDTATSTTTSTTTSTSATSATTGAVAGQFITTKAVKVNGGTNYFNVFSDGKGGTYEQFVVFIPDETEAATAAINAEFITEQKRDKQRTALEEFVSILTGAGLSELADEVNKMILEDKTAAQIKLEIRKTKSYEARFPGMKSLSDKNRAITEGQYIDLERGYAQTLRAYGLDEKIYGDRGDLGLYISNEVSAREFEERVSLAKDRVSSQADVMKALGEMYVTEADAIGYLLNPLKEMDVIKKQVRAAEIGAAAASARFTLGADAANRAREAEALIGATGTTDVATLKQEFGKARILADTQSQLAKLERENYNELEAVQAVVGGEQEKLLKSKRRAEREAMFRFGGQSGVGAYSLRSTTSQ